MFLVEPFQRSKVSQLMFNSSTCFFANGVSNFAIEFLVVHIPGRSFVNGCYCCDPECFTSATYKIINSYYRKEIPDDSKRNP